MKFQVKLALATGVLVLGLCGVAMAGPHYAPGPSYEPAPGPPSHAKAHGFRCKGFSKKHVPGEQGTPFSRCVKAMAQAKKHEHMPPGRACKGMSKKHVKGEKGTPFSRCVKKVAQMRKEQREQEATATA